MSHRQRRFLLSWERNYDVVEEPYARQYWGPSSREGRWKNLFSDMGLAEIPKGKAVNSAPYDVETAYSPHR